MVKIDERRVLTKLIEHLKDSLPYEIWCRKNCVIKGRKVFPTQPEIDLIICRKEGSTKVPPLFAAEVKYVRYAKTGHITPSYYSGLDEALALLVLGFDGVLLIHIVEGNTLSRAFLKYAELLSHMIKSLDLPLGYRVYYLRASEDLRIYRTILVEPNNIYDLESLWIDPPPNPLLNANSRIGNIARKNRKALMEIFGLKTFAPTKASQT